MNDYHFITYWSVPASCEKVYRTLEEVERLTEWWPSVYLDVRVLDKGQAGGVGKLVELYTKGWLPYTLRWKFRVTEADFPNGFSLQALGDFSGTGAWTFQTTGDGYCKVTYDWQIQANKPLLKKLTPLLRPLFSLNHHWAMRMGERSLRLEIRRRQAKTAAERAAVPPPPGPTFPHNLTNNKVLGDTPKPA
jgi:hypothetical protein